MKPNYFQMNACADIVSISFRVFIEQLYNLLPSTITQNISNYLTEPSLLQVLKIFKTTVTVFGWRTLTLTHKTFISLSISCKYRMIIAFLDVSHNSTQKSQLPDSHNTFHNRM